MSVKSRLGSAAQKARKFGNLAAVVSRKAGMGEVASNIKNRSTQLAELIESAAEQS